MMTNNSKRDNFSHLYHHVFSLERIVKRSILKRDKDIDF